MNDFHFLRPNFLLLFIPFLGLFIWMIRSRKTASIWNKVCSKDLLPYVLGGQSKTNRWPDVLMIFVGSLLITALAGPTWELKLQPLVKSSSDLVIALDLSPAMNASDVKPTRLQRSIYKITDLLNLRKEGQTALIVFSEDPYVVTPLTDDIATIKAMLPVLETNIMPSKGHHVEKAIEKASELLIQNGSVLVVGSELSEQELEKSIEIAAKHGISVSVWAVGTEDGAPIPNPDGGFEKDSKGALIVSRLSKDQFSRLAKATQGSFKIMRGDDSDSQEFAYQFSRIGFNDAHEETELSQNQWHDAGYWLVLAAVPFISLFFRRGLLLTLIMLPMGLSGDLWKTSDQQAEALFHEEKYEEARDLFADRDWLGATHYRLGDYEKAAACFQNNESVEGYYNCGTAKAKHGDYEGALECYKKGLEIDPKHEDTLYNKKIIEEMMEQNKDDQQQQNQQDKKEEEKKDSDDQSQDQKENNDQPQDQKENNDQPEEKKDNEQKEQSSENKEEQSAQEMEETESDPQREMDDRWLQKVADDPGGLLRRKFLQQYKQKTKGSHI